MNITVFGARGDVGSRIIAEATSRGHNVTGVVRSPAQVDQLPKNVIPRAIDANDTNAVTDLIKGQDLAISAVRPPDGQEQTLVATTRSILDAAAAASVRILVVGGAASLKMPDDDTMTVLSAPGFLPDHVISIATACFNQFDICITHPEANWTYACPPAMLVPGERMGQYRLGSDTLLVDGSNISKISMEDFAVALIDEAETPRHIMARFTVAY